MNVETQHALELDAVKVFIWRHQGARDPEAAEVAEGRLRWVPWPLGEEMRPALVLSPQEVKDLAEGLAGLIPPTQATTLHLEDAIKVRDRLLTLIERKEVN